MSEALALSMLYEILVSESKYESRGIDYRTKLRALYHQLLKERQTQNDTNHKISKQSSNKLLECLSDSIRVLDPTQIQPTDLELCYGIHQYVFPKIPDLNTLDIRFVSKWNKFYNTFPAYAKLQDRKSKRQNEKQKTYQMSKRRYYRESDSSSESSESDTIQNLQVLMTEEDFGNEETDSKTPKNDELDGLNKVEDPGANLPIDDEPEGHVRLPLVMNKDVEITDDSIVFGLMDDEKLIEWVSTSSIHNYDELYKEMYTCDPTLKYFLIQNKDMNKDSNNNIYRDNSKETEREMYKQDKYDAFDILAKEANLDLNDGPEYDETGRAEYLTEDDTDDSFYFKDYKSDISDGCDKLDSYETLKGIKTESIYSSSSNTNSEEMNEQLIDTNDFYKEIKIKTLPGNYKQNTEKFEVDSIFGNYYCPISSTTSDNIKDIQGEFNTMPRKRGRPKKIKTQTPSSTTLVDSLDIIDTLNSSIDLGIKSEQLENIEQEYGYKEQQKEYDRVDLNNLMNVKTFTVNFMEVESTYSCNNMGGFEVRCSAKIKDPFVPGIMKGKLDTAMGVYQELQEMLKKLFSLKKRITGNCSVCSGWNLLHGIAQTFCEYCEDKLVNSDPELILKIFEIRRQLVNNLYPVVGYKYETLELFNEGDLIDNWKELINQQKVSIQSLIQVGASYPKASLHDSRYLPTPITLPETMCNTINTFQYPKSNLNMSPIQINLNSLTKEELDIQVNTPTKIFPFSFPFSYNSYSCPSSYIETGSNSSKCGSASLNDSYSFEKQDYSDNTSRRLHSYGLMDIVNQRRYNRAKMFNEFFEDIFNAYHSISYRKKSSQLISNYNNILKNGLLLSSRLLGPYTEQSDDEDMDSDNDNDSSVQSDKDDTPASNIRTRRSDRNTNDKEEYKENEQKQKKKKKEDNKNKDKSERDKQENKNTKDNKNKENDKTGQKDDKDKENENYYDEEVSFVLSRLPLDTDMIKLSFYHRGIFLTKRSNTKSYIFVNIGKMFGFKEILVPESVEDNINNRDDKDYKEELEEYRYNDNEENKDKDNSNKNEECDKEYKVVDDLEFNSQDTYNTTSSERTNEYSLTPNETSNVDYEEEDNNNNKDKTEQMNTIPETPDSVKDRFGVSSQSPFEDCIFTDPDYVNEFELKIQDDDDNNNKSEKQENKDNKSKEIKESQEDELDSQYSNRDNDEDEKEMNKEKRKEKEKKKDKENNKQYKEKEEYDNESRENQLSTGRSYDFGNMILNYNWHEMLYRNLKNKPNLVDESNKLKVIRNMLNIDEDNISDYLSDNDVDVGSNEEYVEDKDKQDKNKKGNKEYKELKKQKEYEKTENNTLDKDKTEQEKSVEDDKVDLEFNSQDSSNSSLENNENTGLNMKHKKKNVINIQIMKMMYENGMLQNMPMCILNNFYNTGKIKIGFPTSLEMYMLNIPDSIMDCTMYGGVGKGFLYSLDTIINNLSILSSIIRVGTVGNKRRKFSKT